MFAAAARAWLGRDIRDRHRQQYGSGARFTQALTAMQRVQ
jgi:hypothetical protein